MNPPQQLTRLLTRKNALDHSRLDIGALAPLQPGEALLQIRRVALTTNNITYAAFGDAMQYWDFFPTDEADFGHMPVWGFADVVASTVDGVTVGERAHALCRLFGRRRLARQNPPPLWQPVGVRLLCRLGAEHELPARHRFARS